MTTLKLLVGACVILSCGGKQSPSLSETEQSAAVPEGKQGSAQPKREVFTETKLEILDEISFSTGAILTEESNKPLDAIANILDGNPDIELLGVEATAQCKSLPSFAASP